MKNANRVYIVEDVAISRMSLETMLQENHFEIAGSSASAEYAWEEIQQRSIDLVLLDINLAGKKNGVWLAQQIRKKLDLPIIYLTAFGDQQTLKEVLATKPNGYLMKPFQEPTLLTTISIALDNFTKEKGKRVVESFREDEAFVFVKDSNTKVRLDCDAICYVKSDGNYIEIILKGKKHVIRKKLLTFANELTSGVFVQIHQRYVVNIHKIQSLGRDFIEVNNEILPLSTKYKKNIEAKLSKL